MTTLRCQDSQDEHVRHFTITSGLHTVQMNNVGDGGSIDGFDGFNLDVDPALAAFLERCAPLQDASRVRLPLQKKMSYHQRRREEIQRLREEVNALSKKLERQQTVSELRQETGRPVAMTHNTSEPKGEKLLWKYIAGREQQHLQKSMEEHEALRQLVDSKRQEIENLQRVLKGQLQDSLSVISL